MTQSESTLYTTYINNKPYNIPSAAPPPYDSLMDLPDVDYSDPSPSNIIVNANTKIRGAGNVLALSPNHVAARITTTILRLLRNASTDDEDDDTTSVGIASGINITLNCNFDVQGDKNIIGDSLVLARMQMAAQQKAALASQPSTTSAIATAESGAPPGMPASGALKRTASFQDDDLVDVPEPKRVRVDSAASVGMIDAGAAELASE